MYCTVNFSKKITNEEYYILENLFNDLNNFQYKGLHHYARVSLLIYNYKNFQLKLTRQKLTGVGSLTKVYCGNNLQNMSFQNIVSVLAELKTVLKIELNDAVITRLDVGATILIKNAPSYYLRAMNAPIGFKTSMENDFETLYFKSDVLNYCFYDKNLEAFNKKQYKILAQAGDYKLRYEIQIKKPSKFLSLPVLTWLDLYSQEIYDRLLKAWYEKFQLLPFKADSNLSLPDFDTFKAFKESFRLLGIEFYGGFSEALKLAKNSTVSKHERFKMKKWLVSLKVVIRPKGSFAGYLSEKVCEVYQTKCSHPYHSLIA